MRDNNFKCDADSKVRIMEAMKNAYQPNPFTYEIDSNPTARIDCRAIGITKEGKTLHYAIECKHRNCTPSTYECYFCEPAKFDTIKWATVKDEVDKGIIANEFSDGSVYLWDIDDLDPSNTVKTRIARTTVGTGAYNSEKIYQYRILMPLTKGTRIK